MHITVKLFAILRQQSGASEIHLDLPPAATVEAASKKIAQEFPALVAALHRVAFAVNRSYVPSNTILHDGDELAIIPPVSGG